MEVYAKQNRSHQKARVRNEGVSAKSMIYIDYLY